MSSSSTLFRCSQTESAPWHVELNIILKRFLAKCLSLALLVGSQLCRPSAGRNELNVVYTAYRLAGGSAMKKLVKNLKNDTFRSCLKSKSKEN